MTGLNAALTCRILVGKKGGKFIEPSENDFFIFASKGDNRRLLKIVKYLYTTSPSLMADFTCLHLLGNEFVLKFGTSATISDLLLWKRYNKCSLFYRKGALTLSLNSRLLTVPQDLPVIFSKFSRFSEGQNCCLSQGKRTHRGRFQFFSNVHKKWKTTNTILFLR